VPAGERRRLQRDRAHLRRAGTGTERCVPPTGAPSVLQYVPLGNYDLTRGGRGDALSQKALTFGDIDFLREASGVPVVVKSVLRYDDMTQALAHGAAAVWVSNHGGRQLDGVIPSLAGLGAAVEAARGRVPVIVDGGVRRGTDVFKALALGASAVAIGRPVVWGLTVGGAQGVQSVYDFLASELRTTMCLSGVGTIAEIDRDLIRPAAGAWR
jgi:isopentenyl diphosphate isomerase/L-lactate dehydrogenase-like FMN-dependent dehydrogenase